MGPKPGFSQATLSGKAVTVTGHTNQDDLDDIVEVRVVVAQGDKLGRAELNGGFDASWTIDVEGDFAPGPATVFGMETRKQNFSTVTWVNTLEIT